MEVSKHQRFVVERLPRSKLREHPKNPRRIGEGAKKKLRDKLKEVGLLEPLIFNRRTGYLLGGHQRLENLDSLEKYQDGKRDYMLDVSVVDLDEKQEAEMIVFLNNPSAQGTWDLGALADFGEITSFTSMGFDRADIEIMFGGDPRFEMGFTDTAQTKENKEALDAFKQEGKEVKASKKASLDDVKAHRKEYAERIEEEQNADYYVTVVCQNKAEKDKLMEHLGIPKGEAYISPAEILALRRP